MVDFFLALMIPGAGDELQGLKKGLLEIADMIVVNKADGNTITAAQRAASEYKRAIHILTPTSLNWTPPSLTCSALNGDGLAEIWQEIENHRRVLTSSGELEKKRKEQRVRWMWSLIKNRLFLEMIENKSVQKLVGELECEVMDDKITPGLAASRVIAAVRSR
jgi:LAO/AO transport system kinase